MAIKANIVIEQGATFSSGIDVADIDGTPYNLSGYSVASQMRKSYTSSNAVSFSCSHNSTGGVITISLSATATTAINPGRYMYDVEITSNTAIVTRVVEGIVTVTPNFTRA